MMLADSLVEKGHAHASGMKGWVAAVDKRYKDFHERMEKYRVKLETTLGLTQDVSHVTAVVRKRRRSHFPLSSFNLERFRIRRCLTPPPHPTLILSLK